MDADIKKEIEQIIQTHCAMVKQLRTGGIDTVIAAVDAVTKRLKQGGTVYICGNGGSAADAQHIAGELVGRFRRERKALPAVALSTDTSVITSIANDYSYEEIFTRQVEALVKADDVLWAISTSGNSQNIVAAAESAKNQGALVLVFTGRKESRLEQIADICLCADSDSTARSQEIHQLAYHIICDLVEMNFSTGK